MRKCIKIFIAILSFILICNYITGKTSIGFLVDPNTKLFPRLNRKEITLESGDTYRIRVLALNKRVTYKSLDFKVAYVNLNGKVFAKKAGVTYIQVKAGKEKMRCRIRVLKINRKNVTLSQGEHYKLTIYGDGLIQLLSWKSSNSSIACVNRFGTVTAKRKGHVVISCKVSRITLSCKVKVE